MKAFSLSVLVVCISAAPALAGNRAEEIARQNPAASPYQVLEQFYNEASLPASVDDVDQVGSKSGQHCVLAGKKSTEAYSFTLMRYNKVIPGKPAHGPLLPATPDEIVPVLVFAANMDREKLEDYASNIARQIQMIASPTELVVSCDGFYGDAPVKLSLRKNGDLLAIKEESRIGTPQQDNGFGYCWRD